jgi:uncharacterized membrane protein YidH (DUF202 family)
MHFLKASAFLFAVFLLPTVTSAQGLADGTGGGDFQVLLNNILVFTNNVLIPFIIGIGFLVFVWGMFQYFIFGGANDDSKKNGKSLMIWATIGFVMIIIFWGIVELLASSTGLQNENINYLIPKVTPL